MEFQIINGELVGTGQSSKELVQLWALLKPVELIEKDRPLVGWLLSQGLPAIGAFEDLLLRVRKHTVVAYLRTEAASPPGEPESRVIDWTQTNPP